MTPDEAARTSRTCPSCGQAALIPKRGGSHCAQCGCVYENKDGPVLIVLYDTREQNPIEALPGVVMRRVTMETGDYTTEKLQAIGVLERKSVGDFSSSISHGRERFEDELRRLRTYRFRAIVVEGEIGDTWRNNGLHPHSVIGTCASFFARSDCPVLFGGSRAGAARLIFGILRRWQERLEEEEGKPTP